MLVEDRGVARREDIPVALRAGGPRRVGEAAALLRILGDRATAERLGSGARRTGEEWGISPGEDAAMRPHSAAARHGRSSRFDLLH